MKMKRIDAITKGKNTLMSLFISRKAARIMRNVEQAISCAEDKVDELNDKAQSLIDSLGDVAEADQTGMCQGKLNSYIDTIKEYNEWVDTLKILNELKTSLNEEVEVQEEEK